MYLDLNFIDCANTDGYFIQLFVMKTILIRSGLNVKEAIVSEFRS